jgi:hypothetical protein
MKTTVEFLAECLRWGCGKELFAARDEFFSADTSEAEAQDEIRYVISQGRYD